MDINYYYTTYINKRTLISDIIKLDMKISINMDSSKIPGATDKDTQAKSFRMYQEATGEITLTDLGKPFIEPDVSKAKK